MGLGEQGFGQRLGHSQYFQIKQQQQQSQVQRSGSYNGLPSLSDALVPSMPLQDSTSFVASSIPPKVTTISRPPAIAYRPIYAFDLEVLQEAHEAFFPIKYATSLLGIEVHVCSYCQL
jgi:hypothetical protein